MNTYFIFRFFNLLLSKMKIMQKIIKILILSIVISTISTSCVSRKEILYFQNDKEISDIKRENFILKFKKNDVLTIDVSSSDLDAVKPFNLATVAYGSITNTASGTPKQQTYIINNKGEINFPLLGEIKLEGLSRDETITLITKKLKPYVNDVTVNLNIINFRINVMGDVKNPGSFLIPNGKVTIVDALALAGDLNLSGIRVVEVKRETTSGIESGLVDLKSNKLFSSPFYYLKQNDIVYVSPNKARSQSASFNQNTGVIISTASIIISLISVLIR